MVQTTQPTATLNSGDKIPLLGLGTCESETGVVQAAVEKAIHVGYRHIDSSKIYEEKEVGAALKNVFNEGVVKREDVWVTTKLWNADHGKVEEALRGALSDLGLDYVDLYHMHWPLSANEGPEVEPPLAQTWLEMNKMKNKGLARNVGVSNFSAKKLAKLIQETNITPSVLQVELHPFWRQDSLLKFCQEHDIHVTAYSPLGSSDSPQGQDAGEAKAPLKADATSKIAQDVGKSTGQVLVRWAIQRGTSVLPRSSNPDRIEQNFNVLDWELPKSAMRELNSFTPQSRIQTGEEFLKAGGPYKTVEELWDGPNTVKEE